MTFLSRPFALLIACLVLGGTACDRLQPPPAPSPPPPPPRADFRVVEPRGVDPLDRGVVPQADVEMVTAVINQYYNIAFIQPDKWEGGKHLGVTHTFTAEAQPQVLTNLNTLALGELAPGIERVTPGRQEISRVAFFFENDGSVPIAIAEVNFDATVTVKAPPQPAKKTPSKSPSSKTPAAAASPAPSPSPSPSPLAGPIKIVHTARFWLSKQGETYKISAFAVDLKADTIKITTKKTPKKKGKR